MKNKNKAFTLTELLLALGIVGTIAALSIPSLMDNIHKRINVGHLKNVVHDINYIIEEQRLNYNTKNLDSTDFKDASIIIGQFASTQNCEDTNAECWGEKYKKISDMSEIDVGFNYTKGKAVKLKNGASLYYKINDGTMGPSNTIGSFIIDVNGKDKPNIIGRDLFSFYLDNSGQITDRPVGMAEETSENSENSEETTPEQQRIASCNNGSAPACFWLIVNNNWQMKY